jgi:hypothetical protein
LGGPQVEAAPEADAGFSAAPHNTQNSEKQTAANQRDAAPRRELPGDDEMVPGCHASVQPLTLRPQALRRARAGGGGRLGRTDIPAPLTFIFRPALSPRLSLRPASPSAIIGQ